MLTETPGRAPRRIPRAVNAKIKRRNLGDEKIVARLAPKY